MSANIIQTNYDVLEQIARYFALESDSMNLLLSQVAMQSERLCGGGWTGVGALAFFGEMSDTVFPAMKRLVGALNEASTSTQNISRVLAEAEEEAAALFRGPSETADPFMGGMLPQQTPTPQPPGPQNDSERRIKDLCKQIIDSAAGYGVAPEVIAGIIYNEMQNYDAGDSIQDAMAGTALGYLLPDTASLGAAQMQIGVVLELAKNGYIFPEDAEMYKNNPKGWAIGILRNDRMAPMLVAARMKQTIDTWKQGGVDISNMPDIQATLYHLGLTGKQGVHPNPQPDDRGSEIAKTLPRMKELLDGC